MLIELPEDERQVSLHMMAQVWQMNLPPKAKFILLAYADGAEVWPPLVIHSDLLAWKTGYSQEEVRIIIGQLMCMPGLFEDVP